MRIRRRPQSSQALSSLHPSDPSTAPPQPPPRNHGRFWLSGVNEEEKEEKNKKLERLHLHPNADLGDDDSSAVMRAAAALPLFPQDNAVVVECSKMRNGGGGAQQGAADGHRSLKNGHYSKPEPAIRTGERLVNGVVRAMPMAVNNVKEESKSDSNGGSGGGGAKKRRGPAVLMEGSRCSRVNGRGWRCSQPTLVGYSLCEHHLGKGRMRSVTGGRSGGGAGQLGRTERKNAVAAEVVVAAAEPPVVRPC